MTRAVAVVTGASRGIGAAAALALARDGYDIVAVHRRDESAAESSRTEIERSDARCHVVRANLASPGECTSVVDAVLTSFGRVDALVHAAGAVSSGRDVAETTDDELDLLLAVHVHAPFRLTRDLLPALRRSERPAIVFVSSSVTRHMRGGGAPYNVAKAGLEALARTLAAEERIHGVRVNVVSPGLVDTELGRRFVRAAHGVEIDALAPLLPFGRVCRPDEVAEVVRWLASPAASYVTGENIAINGGDDRVASEVAATRVALAERTEEGR